MKVLTTKTEHLSSIQTYSQIIRHIHTYFQTYIHVSHTLTHICRHVYMYTNVHILLSLFSFSIAANILFGEDLNNVYLSSEGPGYCPRYNATTVHPGGSKEEMAS